jgi:pantoate kinase
LATRICKAFSPAGISSFFEICDQTPNGRPIKDLERVGARGGGFGLKRGVLTEVAVAGAKRKTVTVFINGKLTAEAQTTRTVVDLLQEKVEQPSSIVIRHRVDVPIGAGFGASAGGALTTALALSKALGLNLTYRDIGRIAHVAEVKCKTGLGTVSGILFGGGCVIVLEPGAPNHGSVDCIPVPPDYYIVAGVFEPRLTSEFLKSTRKRKIINDMAQKTLERILAEPSLECFLQSSREFAEKTGLATKRVVKLMDAAEKAGALGAAQNMLGEAVHALVEKDKLKSVLAAFERLLPPDKIVVAEVSLCGAQLVA